jgi:hypothetical protein
MHIRFKNPYIFEGETHEGIDLDLDGLKGSDLEKAQEIVSVQRKRMGSAVPELSKAYCAQVAALSAKVPCEFISGLPAKEYARVTLEVQNFLLDGVSDQESTQ